MMMLDKVLLAMMDLKNAIEEYKESYVETSLWKDEPPDLIYAREFHKKYPFISITSIHNYCKLYPKITKSRKEVNHWVCSESGMISALCQSSGMKAKFDLLKNKFAP